MFKRRRLYELAEITNYIAEYRQLRSQDRQADVEMLNVMREVIMRFNEYLLDEKGK